MFLTIFTPTYNRKHLLIRLYESLCSQQCQDFEWLVVDDGSTDGTDAFIADLVADGKISISFIRKENGGKHTAHNVALKYAKGEYFFTVDSDDWLPADSILKIKGIIATNASISNLSDIAGIIALKSYADGNIIGHPFNKDNFTTHLYELEHSDNKGDRTLIFKTEVIRQFPFPVIDGERFMTESVIYDQIDQRYSFYVSNENLTECEYQIDGLSSNPKRLMFNNPGGYAIYFTQKADYTKYFGKIIKYLLQANCFNYIYKGNVVLNQSHNHKLLNLLLKPLGWIASFHYKKFAR